MSMLNTAVSIISHALTMSPVGDIIIYSVMRDGDSVSPYNASTLGGYFEMAVNTPFKGSEIEELKGEWVPLPILVELFSPALLNVIAAGAVIDVDKGIRFDREGVESILFDIEIRGVKTVKSYHAAKFGTLIY